MIRRACFAGRFYPKGSATLRALIQELVSAAGEAPTQLTDPTALIVPHAGYRYSGGCAARGYAQLLPPCDSIRRVVVLGTCHSPSRARMVVSSANTFTTPLGSVPVDMDAVEWLRAQDLAVVDDPIHERDHAIEVQLPFLQVLIPAFTLVPVLVGRQVAIDAIVVAIERMWTDPATRIVVSSDLSHGHPQAIAGRMDAATAKAIVALDADALTPQGACGMRAIQGLARAARARGLVANLVDLRCSADAGGPPERVVGYGAFAFWRSPLTQDASTSGV